MTRNMIAIILILSPCGCLANVLVFSKQGLTQIPHVNMSTATILDFTNNTIQSIGPDDFISATAVQVGIFWGRSIINSFHTWFEYISLCVAFAISGVISYHNIYIYNYIHLYYKNQDALALTEQYSFVANWIYNLYRYCTLCYNISYAHLNMHISPMNALFIWRMLLLNVECWTHIGHEKITVHHVYEHTHMTISYIYIHIG